METESRRKFTMNFTGSELLLLLLLLLVRLGGTRKRKNTLVVRSINSFSISTEDRHTEQGAAVFHELSSISIRSYENYRKPARFKSKRRGEREEEGGERGRTTWEDDESSKNETRREGETRLSRERERERGRRMARWKSERIEEEEGSARSAKPALNP